MTGTWRIGEILEAPEIDTLRSLAMTFGECAVVIFDGVANGRVTLRLTVVDFEPHGSELGSTWPTINVQYESAPSASPEQLATYPRRFVAEQIHNYNGEFDHGTMNAL